ncbi:hypothetical protein Pint_20607 [Pistacia integerrima]|uniref:Uncharacterized protein n=2 Tax=Pistacia TaxID=55512 RepID=A0ACC0XD92_9ROSI|nr:hypothetical protein Pint_20607 [Pistacia integerrima]
MVDTGSDLTWVQCDRCVNCFPLREGNFKYQESSTFRPLSCDHPFCVPRICRQGICHYDVNYPQCSPRGWLSQDTFIFSGGTRTSESSLSYLDAVLTIEILHLEMTWDLTMS